MSSCKSFFKFLLVVLLFLLLLFFSTLTKLSFVWILRLSVPPPGSSSSSSSVLFPSPHSADSWRRILETQYGADYFGVDGGVDEDTVPTSERLVGDAPSGLADEKLREEFDVDAFEGELRLRKIGSGLKRQTNSASVNDFFNAQKYLFSAYLLCAVELLNILRCIWHGTYNKQTTTQSWPTLKATVMGIMSSLVESACLVFLLILVFPLLPIYVFLPLLGLALGPSLFTLPLLKYYRKRHQSSPEDTKDIESSAAKENVAGGESLSSSSNSWRWRGCVDLNTAAANVVVVVVGFVAVGIVCIWTEALDAKMTAGTLVILFFLALVWSPLARIASTVPSREKSLCTWRAGLLYSLVRLIAIPLMLWGVGMATGDIPHLRIGIHHMIPNLGGFLIFFWVNYAIFIASLFASHAFGLLGSSICQQKISVFALILSTPLAALLNCLLPPFIPGMELSVGKCEGITNHLVLTIAVSLVWIVFNGIYFKMAVGNNWVYKPEEEILLVPTLGALACEQYFLSNLKCLKDFDLRNLSKSSSCPSHSEMPPRIFICTTMYQEAEFEVKRLLQSISKVANSAFAQTVEIETHIIVDNGIQKRKMGDFSKQLIDLLPSNVNIHISDARVFETPYGLQLRWDSLGATKLTVHLKDSSLVKKKKRWSQIMYMMYVLQLKNNPSAHIYMIDKEFGYLRDYPSPPKQNPRYGNSLTTDGLNGRDGVIGRELGGGNKGDEFTNDDESFSNESGIGRSRTGSSVELPESGQIYSGEKRFEESDSEESSQKSHSFFRNIENSGERIIDDHTYILSTDADMEFDASSVESLVEVLERDRRVGGVCGRTYPVGMKKGPVVWYQMWDYGKEFWLLKSAQQVLGAVLCCPGCFSLYRGSALRQIVTTYSTEVKTPFDTFLKDMGEDRWLCTLMMLKGWKLDYTSLCVNTTFCPESFKEFVKQRRRWIMSEVGNMISVFGNGWKLCRSNDTVSFGYIVLLFVLFASGMLTPSFTICLLSGGLEAASKGYINYKYTMIALILIILLYVVVCIYASPKFQIRFSLWLALFFIILATVMVVGGAVYFITNVVPSGAFHDSYLFLIFLGVVLLAAFLHIRDLPVVAHIIWYFMAFPSLHLLLPVYTVCNIIDQSWGTRELKNKENEETEMQGTENLTFTAEDSIANQTPETADFTLSEYPFLVRGLHQGSIEEKEEHAFWKELCTKYIDVNDPNAVPKPELVQGIRKMRNTYLTLFLLINGLWLVFFSVFYLLFFEPEFTWAIDDIANVIFVVAIYGIILTVLLFSTVTHRISSLGFWTIKKLFSDDHPFWITKRNFSNETS